MDQNKTEKLQTYDTSPFTGQSYIINDGSQSFLIFQPVYKPFKVCNPCRNNIMMGM